MQNIKITVIIPTYNRRQMLEECLYALEVQTFPKDNFEVIVVNDASKDDTAIFLENYKRTTLLNFTIINQKNMGPSAARNNGIKRARGSFIAFTDDDCIPQPSWLEKLIANFPDNPKCAGSGGLIKRKYNTLFSKYIDERATYEHKNKNGKIIILCTANAIYRKKVLDEVRGFITAFKWPGGEDTELSWRIIQAGYFLHSYNGALVLHNHRDSIKGIYKTMFFYGKGANLGNQLGSIFSDFNYKPSKKLLLINLKHILFLFFKKGNIGIRTRFLYLIADTAYYLGLYFGHKSCPVIKKELLFNLKKNE